MELLEIKSGHDLTSHSPVSRRASAHSYLVSCRQFMSVLAKWRKPGTSGALTADGDSTISFMTLGAEQIWVTRAEIGKIQEAIETAHSPVTLP